jgi:hypothetical protein
MDLSAATAANVQDCTERVSRKMEPVSRPWELTHSLQGSARHDRGAPPVHAGNQDVILPVKALAQSMEQVVACILQDARIFPSLLARRS